MPTNCRLSGCVDPARSQRTGSELLDRVESGHHALGRLDLQGRGSLKQRLASPSSHLEPTLKVMLIPGQGHCGGVRGDIQRVKYLRVGGGEPGLVWRRDSFGCHRLAQKQAPGLSEVRPDLRP